MDNPPGSVPAQRRTTLVAFLVLLISVLVITVLMVLPYVLAVTMGGILAVLAQPVFQRLTGYHLTPRVASAVVVLGVVLGVGPCEHRGASLQTSRFFPRINCEYRGPHP